MRNVLDISKYITSGGDYTFHAQWKPENLDVKLYNEKTKEKSLRYTKISVYDSLEGCSGTNGEKPIKTYTQSSKDSKNTGVILIDNPRYNNEGKSKKYYINVKTSKYYDDSNNKCLDINTSRKYIKLYLKPKKFKVKYSGGKKTTGSVNESVKYTDVPITLNSASSLEKSGYTFNYWIASRNVNVNGSYVSEYRGFASEQDKNAKIYSWTSKENCDQYGYRHYKNNSSINVNTYDGDIVMIAKWKKNK